MASWIRFTWNLSQLDIDHCSIPPFNLIKTTDKDCEAVINTVSKAAALDASLMEGSLQIAAWAKSYLPQALANPSTSVLIILHGPRIIATSIISSDPDAEFQLITGPSVLSEYRGRGIAKWLLNESLLALKEAGLSEVHAVAKARSALARYIYPKSGATSSPCLFRIALAP